MSIAHARVIGWLLMAALAATGGGCASQTGPEVIAVSSAQYPATFDAAVEAARKHGMTAMLRDRRSGVIETDARVAGSMMEPWRLDNASFSQGVENTIAFQRRRARFEFSPVGFDEGDRERGEDGRTADPLTEIPVDLTAMDGELELRVWVYVERASTPGLRRGTWSRRMTSNVDRAVTAGSETRDEPATFWTTVARDTAYERRLLVQIQAEMSE